MDSAPDPYQLRRAAPDDTEPEPPWRPGDRAHAEPAAPTYDGPLVWRARPAGTVLKAVGAVLFLAAGIWTSADPVALTVGIVGAVVLAVLAVRDLIAGTTLTADRDGVTIRSGYLGRRRLKWDEIEQIRVDRRSRLGVRTELVELDCDEQLYLFSANQLGAPCDQVADLLQELRTRPRPN